MKPLARQKRAWRLGFTGPVGCGKTTLVEKLAASLNREGLRVGIVTNDIYSTIDEAILRSTGVVPEDRIVGVQTGGCPHTAIRDDTSLNLDVAERLDKAHELDVILIESGGDNLSTIFSEELVDTWAFILDAAGGHKVAAKGGPGIATSPVLVINKVDLAERTATDLSLMQRTAEEVRDGRPVYQTSASTGEGVQSVLGGLISGLPHTMAA